ncbi:MULTISPECIES: four helix bundle protein [Tenacibaculum]|uniref:Four helix bundle protein n=1 Tax=Tenacibaculum lutimaris TaxID=285258 RepID=A0A420E360_9FLAO|nr:MULTISPECIES: four helix bundle protein [Tenacibaculum]NVK09391.1 four helix bundle protein [Tenacibaculum sp.]RKF04479.1 four helix bundle protein [Tenacibaculum lutimaris]RLK06819.1 four helix bundle protein [Tenacibaculum discolor]
MKKGNIIQEKSYDFAVRTVNLYKHLSQERKEFVLSKQLLRSGTSIGANIEEAIGGQSRKDFYAKLTIAYKEARETHYWIRLLKDTGFLSKDTAQSFLNDTEEILKIIGSIQKTIRNS